MYFSTFVIYLILDMLWAWYIYSTASLRTFQSSLSGRLIVVASGFGAINIVHDPKQLITAFIGCFIGTWIVVAWKKRKQMHGNPQTT